MIGIAVILIAFAMADLVAGGLIGQPQGIRRSALGLIVAAVIIVVIGTVYGFDALTTVISTVFGVIAIAGWLMLKSMSLGDKSILGSKLALAWLSAFLLATLLLTPLWKSTLSPEVELWLQKLPLHLQGQSGITRAMVFAGMMLFLSAPANAIVRLCLTVVGTDWRSSQETIRGGRLIGVLERWLIFVLAVAGEPTAAALIISAKSILRFPELNRAARESGRDGAATSHVDIITEYFLLGSLLSWTLALFSAMLFLFAAS